MRKIGLGLVGFGLVGCGGATPEEQASLAAEGYYRHLIAGEYEQFLEGRVGADSLPADYREQLLAGYKQFMAQQETAHQGVRNVQVNTASQDSELQLMQVFLLLQYGDSTEEEIVVPMVDTGDGRWRMR